MASFAAHAAAFGVDADAIAISVHSVQHRNGQMVADPVEVQLTRCQASGVELIAFDDFRIVRDNLKGGTRTARDRLVPLFTHPTAAEEPTVLLTLADVAAAPSPAGQR